MKETVVDYSEEELLEYCTEEIKEMYHRGELHPDVITFYESTDDWDWNAMQKQPVKEECPIEARLVARATRLVSQAKAHEGGEADFWRSIIEDAYEYGLKDGLAAHKPNRKKDRTKNTWKSVKESEAIEPTGQTSCRFAT